MTFWERFYSEVFFWIHFVEPTTSKIGKKISSKLRRIVSKTTHYLVVRCMEGEVFYQLGEVDIMACWPQAGNHQWLGVCGWLFETTNRWNFSMYHDASSGFFRKVLSFFWRPILEPTRVDNKTLPLFLVRKPKKRKSSGDHKTIGLEFTNHLSGYLDPLFLRVGVY